MNKYRFYFIMGSQNVSPTKDPLRLLAEALRAGITCFQLREKGTGSKQGEEKIAFARACQTLCRQYNVPFIVNDDVELALLIGADGIHLGQDDLPMITLEERQAKLLGRSTHNEAEIKQAVAEGAAYVGLGALYPSQTKKDTSHQLSPSKIARIMQQFPELPIIGIGGITEDRVEEVFRQGFNGIAMISALTDAVSIPETMARIKEAAKRGEKEYLQNMNMEEHDEQHF